jgi:hypothetical protein
LEDKSIAIIQDVSDANTDYYLIVLVDNKMLNYNTKGEIFGSFKGSKMKKYIGSKKQLPEYFL